MSGPGDRLCVVGMGNLLYRDEGVGVYAARCLESCYRFSPEVDVLDGATLGFGLLDLFEKDTKIIVLDALLADAPAGTVFRLGLSELLRLGPSVQPTAHEVEPLELLKLAQLLGRSPDMVLLGIVPRDARTMAVGLSPELEAAFPAFVDLAVDEIREAGIDAVRVRERSLEELVESLVTRA